MGAARVIYSNRFSALALVEKSKYFGGIRESIDEVGGKLGTGGQSFIEKLTKLLVNPSTRIDAAIAIYEISGDLSELQIVTCQLLDSDDPHQIECGRELQERFKEN